MSCGECGSKDLKVQSVVGRQLPYKGSVVTVTEPLSLLVCQQCSNMVIRAGEGRLIDAVVKQQLSKSSIRTNNRANKSDW